ncbi:MAG: hypothetical protein OEM85_00230 [Gammaproteobacteria bacterium]|nr:hypothetical protein [Gammaproteobacteria bacterium]
MFEALFKYSDIDYAHGELAYTSLWPIWLWVGLVALAVVAIVLSLLRRYEKGRGLKFASVGLLQFAMLAVAIFVLLQPVLRSEELRPGVNTLALLLDASGSMANGAGGVTRFDTARAQLDIVAETATRTGLEVRRYLLGTEAQGVESFDATVPAAEGTAIARALRDVLPAGRTQALAGIVLVSDGIDTAGGLSAATFAELAAAGVPVHTIAVGRERMPEDLELQRVSMPTRALPASTLTARVSVRHDAAGTARVKVYDGDALVQSVPLQLHADVQTTTAPIDIPIDEAGYHRLQFVLESDGSETELRNNRQSSLVKVAADDFRILYYEGEPRWEYKFMRRALGPDSDIALTTLLQVSPNKFYRQGLDSPEQLAAGFPETRDALFAYDALIIGSVEAAAFSDEQLANISAFVSDRGGSLLLLAGRNGLGDGGWGQSTVADLLPVLLPPSTETSFVREKAHAQLAPQGVRYEPLRLGATDEENRQRWEGLPDLADYQRTTGVKPASRTLLTVRTDTGVLPLLVMQPFGLGQSFVLATGGTWRWQMSLPVDDDRHERFWRQLLRALVSNAPLRTSIVAGRGEGASLDVRVELRDEAFEPIGDMRVSAIATHEGGESQVVELMPDGESPGVFTGRFDPGTPGNWYIEAMARSDDETTEVLRTGIYVDPESREHFNLRANPALLRRLSDVTGGTFFAVNGLDTLPEILQYSSAGITETVDRPVWDAPAWFLLLFMLKSGEWLLRRRWSTI